MVYMHMHGMHTHHGGLRVSSPRVLVGNKVKTFKLAACCWRHMLGSGGGRVASGQSSDLETEALFLRGPGKALGCLVSGFLISGDSYLWKIKLPTLPHVFGRMKREVRNGVGKL